mmetsp:Transcript_38141/g.36505  ORF Transcript_38141/g.36505 Transcript_38141/m.36505 type:complete len:144 (-) Transcript_38141:1801-2232(-)
MAVIRVVLHEEIEEPAFTISELVIQFSVPCDLDGYLLLGLVVETGSHLSKASLPQDLQNLIPIMQVIVKEHIVVTFLIIEFFLELTDALLSTQLQLLVSPIQCLSNKVDAVFLERLNFIDFIAEKSILVSGQKLFLAHVLVFL